MAVKIQKQWGETAYFYTKVGNAGAAQIAVVGVRVGEWWSLGAPFEMPAGSENEYELSGIVWGPIGIYDVTYRVAAGVGGWPILDERVFPGEFEVIAPPPTYFTLTIGISGQGITNPLPGTYTHEAGTNVPIYATPAAGYEFQKWVIDSLTYWEPYYIVPMNSNKVATAYFTQIAPPEERIEEQLASCWPYISGGGTSVSNRAIGAFRNGAWLYYDSRWPDESDLQAFMSGDKVAFWLTQQCTLVYKGRSWVLTPYYEPSFPDWITQITW